MLDSFTDNVGQDNFILDRFNSITIEINLWEPKNKQISLKINK